MNTPIHQKALYVVAFIALLVVWLTAGSAP